jgi:hypothetical protein
MGVDILELYTDTRARLVDMAATLDALAAATPVPATPDWTVKDVYAHLTGLAADFVADRRGGMGSPEWTARQVGARREVELETVCVEWTNLEAPFLAWVRAQETPPTFVGLDIWTHQQDLVATLGREPERDERSGFLIGAALAAFDGRLRRDGAPAVRVIATSADEVIGAGDPIATLRADDHAVLRLLFSRRTLAQMAAAPWEGDPVPALEYLHLFPLPERELPG